MKFNIGDKVRWWSQAGGSWKEKCGHVVQVVPAGMRPDESFTQLHKGFGCGYARNHDSYVVLVKNKHYWPVVTKLTSDK